WLSGIASGMDDYAKAIDGASSATQKQIDKEQALIDKMREKERLIREAEQRNADRKNMQSTSAEEAARIEQLRKSLTNASYYGMDTAKIQAELKEAIEQHKANEEARKDNLDSEAAAKGGMTLDEYRAKQEKEKEDKHVADVMEKSAAAQKAMAGPPDFSKMTVTNERGE